MDAEIGCHLFGNLPGVNVMTTISPLIISVLSRINSLLTKEKKSDYKLMPSISQSLFFSDRFVAHQG